MVNLCLIIIILIIIISKSLLKIDRENDYALATIAQMALRRNDLATATLHFRQVLERKPCHYEALSQFIEVCHRRGCLPDAQPCLELAEMKAIHGHNEPGLNFCRGFYEFLAGQPNAALLAFNKARGQSLWGQKAIRCMLDICLSNENEMLENVTDLDMEVQDMELMALHTSARLLQELQPLPDDILQTHVLYPNFYLLATRQKNNVERALQELTSLAAQTTSSQRENPGALLGIATAHLVMQFLDPSSSESSSVVNLMFIFYLPSS